jgi:hypothetical protein
MSGTLSLLGSSNVNLGVLMLQGIEYKEVTFANSESYRGGWRGGTVRVPRYLESA